MPSLIRASIGYVKDSIKRGRETRRVRNLIRLFWSIELNDEFNTDHRFRVLSATQVVRAWCRFKRRVCPLTSSFSGHVQCYVGHDDFHRAHRASNEGSLIRGRRWTQTRPWWDSSGAGVGEEADTMTPDTQAPYKEIIHDVHATNY